MAGGDLDVEDLSAIVVDAAYHIHSALGPGLLESVYESILTRSLEKRGLLAERQKALTFEYDGMRFANGLRVDLLVNGRLVVEVKSADRIAPVHVKQMLTYLRLLDLRLGLLINFGAATFREGCRRVVNGRLSRQSSRLRVNRASSQVQDPEDLTRRHEGHEDDRTPEG